MDVRPEKALVLREGNLVLESPKKIKVGEIIEIKAGERVPLDGTMQNEVAAFNTAALTGESAPRNNSERGGSACRNDCNRQGNPT